MRKTLVVLESNAREVLGLEDVLTFKEYLTLYPKKGESNVNVINLCDSRDYLSQGYYCSLLAEARSHNVLPTVKTLNALRARGNIILVFQSQVFADIQIDSIWGKPQLCCLGKF